ncbi:MAG: hypothetical protein K0U52_00610 [Gammaproteobacteria bacterium]|nr:hypothetical protein [Gammaproteobacteria bacterium]
MDYQYREPVKPEPTPKERLKHFHQQLESHNMATAAGVQWAYNVFRNMLQQIPNVLVAQTADEFGQLLINADGGHIDQFRGSHLVQTIFTQLAEHGSVNSETILRQSVRQITDELMQGMDANTFVQRVFPEVYMALKDVHNQRKEFDNFRQATMR